MSLFLRNATFVDGDASGLTRGDFAVEVGPGGGVAAVDAIPAGAEVVDCDGKLVTRAFAIAHHHLYSVLARGMPAPPRTPESFREILELVWWRLDRALDGEMILASARAGALEAALSGCTFVVDHHSSPTAIEGSLALLAQGLEEVGLGHLLCYELSDRDGPASAAAGLAESERHLRERPGLVGLHASFTVGDELLERAVGLARDQGTGLHVHLAEARSDPEHCRATHGVGPVERFARAGVLDSERSLLVHALHLEEAERERLAASPAWVVQCTESNQQNGVGSFDPAGLGERLLIGTDGMHSDPLRAARASFLADCGLGRGSAAATLARLRSVDRYRALATPGDAGTNDLVVLDYAPPTPITTDNWPAHLVHGLGSRHVRTVIRQGRVLVEDGCVLGVDAEAIRAHAREQAARLWERL